MIIDKKQATEKTIELLAPAGDFDSLKAAIGNGADSVYIGASLFNARKRAKNFAAAQIPAAIDYAHERSRRVYMALNILLTGNELEAAYETAAQAWEDGIDAVIVQDFGFAALLKRRIPRIILHASTQATIYDEYAVDACSDLGFTRIILPRELSIADIARITRYAGNKGIETEVFAHGALCVCYSGQCAMSSTIGGRSGNRGDCAQPCRLNYRIEINGHSPKSTEPRLGMRDISAIDHISELISAGVGALKIEGRMRSAEYVGIVTGEFSEKIGAITGYGDRTVLSADAGVIGRPAAAASAASGTHVPLPDRSKQNLLLAFNRGGSFADNYLTGKKGPDMVSGSKAGSYGISLGAISSTNSRLGIVDIAMDPQTGTAFPEKGDVLAVRRGAAGEEIANAPMGEVMITGTGIRVKGFHPDVIQKLQNGDDVFRMSDTRLSAKALSADKGRTLLKGRFGETTDGYFIEWTVADGISKGFQSRYEIKKPAYESNGQEHRHTVSDERCKEQLSKSGGTPFTIAEIIVEQLPSVPVSYLNQIRRESFMELQQTLIESFKRPQAPAVQEEKPELTYSEIEALLGNIDILKTGFTGLNLSDNSARSNLVSAYFYEWDGTSQSLDCGADIYELPVWNFFDDSAFQSITELRRNQPGAKVVIALPPAFTGEKYDEMIGVLRRAAASGIDAVLSGNPGNHLLCKEIGLTDMRDSSANIFNPCTFEEIQKTGAYSLMPSIELSVGPISEIAAASQRISSSYIELAGYGRTRLMYSEHCPVGYNRPGCRICSVNRVFRINDRKNVSFPVICHNLTCTVDILNADILCAPEEVKKLSDKAPVIARLSFTDESRNTRSDLISNFKSILSGTADPKEMDEKIKTIKAIAMKEAAKSGNTVTGGHYIRGII
ncbi:MAG: U32 family peptidase [Saccharofermentanales bacterium]